MNNTEKYEMLANKEARLPSDIAVIPAIEGFKFSLIDIKRSLENNKSFKLISFSDIAPSTPEVQLDMSAEIEYKGSNYTIELSVSPVAEFDLKDYGLGNQISETEFKKASKQLFLLESIMYFQDEALVDFLLQLKVLNAIVPQAALVIDFMPGRMLSGDWLRMTTATDTPPSTDYLYTTHAIYEGEDKKRVYWLHTHGLLRCGSVELEMLNLGAGAQHVYHMISTAAKKFIEEMPAEREEFTVGYDGMGLRSCWVRWEEALKLLPANLKLGGMGDREEGSIHCEPSGVLFAVEDGELISPEIYAETLADDPLLYISDSETDRMSNMAKERVQYFEEAFNQYKNNEDWGFIVKLGIATDEDAEDATSREHMWFGVSNIANGKITGELLNQPYWVKGLNKGDISEYPVNILTDWVIYSPNASQGSFTPDSIYEYYQKD